MLRGRFCYSLCSSRRFRCSIRKFLSVYR
ncbi:hypothetical protein CPC698_0363A, partial [Chlamydia psittaci C6/98]